MACGTCGKNKQISTERPRVLVGLSNANTQEESQPQTKAQIASPKFQIPKVLPPLK